MVSVSVPGVVSVVLIQILSASFERRFPEVYDGVVSIRSIARRGRPSVLRLLFLPLMSVLIQLVLALV